VEAETKMRNDKKVAVVDFLKFIRTSFVRSLVNNDLKFWVLPAMFALAIAEVNNAPLLKTGDDQFWSESSTSRELARFSESIQGVVD
jgi:hypothetical protein